MSDPSERHHTAGVEEQPRLTDAERITQGIAWAEQKQRQITHATARSIAAQLHDGQGSAMYGFTSCGAIDKERLGFELAGTFTTAGDDQEGEQVRDWTVALGRYLERYDDRGPVEGWSNRHRIEATPTFGADDCCVRCGAHVSEPHTSGCQNELQYSGEVEVYVASLTDYNNGHLHGIWMNAALDPEDMQRGIDFMLSNSYYPDAEEWAIHDYSGFHGLNVGEYISTSDLSTLAQGIEQHGEAFAHWFNYMDAGLTDVAGTARQFEDYYLGHYDSAEAYAEEILDGGDYNRLIDEAREQLPEHLRDYLKFDVRGYAESLETSSHIVEGSSGIYVFSL